MHGDGPVKRQEQVSGKRRQSGRVCRLKGLSQQEKVIHLLHQGFLLGAYPVTLQMGAYMVGGQGMTIHRQPRSKPFNDH
jgi:hypothetical protein